VARSLSPLGKFVVGSAIVTIIVSITAYVVTRKDGPQMTPLMEQLTETTTVDFAKQIPRYRDVETIYLIVHGRGHRTPELQFREKLREAVVASDKYRVARWKEMEDTLKQNQNVFRKLFNKFLSDDQGNFQEPTSVEAASAVIEQLDNANYKPEIDGILVVDVTDFYEGPGQDGLGAKVGVEAKLWAKREAKVVTTMPRIQHSIESAWDRRYLNHRAKQWNFFLRFFAWFVIACGLPWGGIQLVRAVLKRRNNGLTFTLLGILIVIDLVIAWPLLFAFALGGGVIVGCVIVGAMMAYYNYDAVEYINRRLL